MVAHVGQDVADDANGKHGVVSGSTVVTVGKCKWHCKEKKPQVGGQHGQARGTTVQSVVIQPLYDDNLKYTSGTENEIRAKASRRR